MSISEKIKEFAVVGRLIIGKEKPDDEIPPVGTNAYKEYMIWKSVKTTVRENGVERGRKIAENREKRKAKKKAKRTKK